MIEMIKKVLASLPNRTSTKDINQRIKENHKQINLILKGLEERGY